MELLFFGFLENMALIIALLYLGLKVKEFILKKVINPLRLLWLSSIFIGFLSVSIMFHPIEFKGMRIDLREVPLFFITYIGGWKLGILSAVFPGIYRFSFGGSTVWQGIFQTIILPVIVGGLFHKKKAFLPPYTIINMKHMAISFVIFQVIKSLLMFFSTPATISFILIMFLFSFIALIGIGLMTNDFNQKAITREKYEFLSNHDPMTHLPNIRYFKEKVQRFLTKKTPLAIAMVDVDYFKVYNDTHGHQAGDEILWNIGQLLQESVRKEDWIARYGGEEFIICYKNVADAAEAADIAERFQHKVKKHVFYGEETQPGGELTISIGISFFTGRESMEELIGEADEALYQSKQKGRNQITIYQESKKQTN